MDNFRITQFGKPLDKSLYTIDLENKVFSSYESDLVFDFINLRGWIFNTGNACTFNAGAVFELCTFHTGRDCTFYTAAGCIFNTGSYCTFKTGNYCTFRTGEGCTFMLRNINTCKFKSHDDISIILDREDNKHYILTKELIDMIKVING